MGQVPSWKLPFFVWIEKGVYLGDDFILTINLQISLFMTMMNILTVSVCLL